MRFRKNRKLIIIVVLVLVAFGISIIAANTNTKKDASTTKDVTTGAGEYYDANSKQTVSDPAGKTPENYGTESDAPAFFGTSNLIDYGLSAAQEKDMEFAIYKYFNANSKKISEVSIVVDSIAPVERDRDSVSTTETINFDFVVDRKDRYKVRMDYFDLISIQMYISDATGTNQLHDSGVVSNQSL